MTEQDLRTISSVIDNEKELFHSVSQSIWNSPELSFQENHAHDTLIETFAKRGISVIANFMLKTAFRASHFTGEGPKIAILLEYDALPEIGHACGHNLIAEAGLAAVIAVKAAMDSDPSIKGTIIALGTPAEESGGGKVKLIEHGAFGDIDVAMMIHPDNKNWFQPVLISLLSMTVNFEGKESHASAFPWEGVNALDAAVTLYQSISLLRQQMKPTCIINAIITKGGIVPNIIPADSRIEIYIRAPDNDELGLIKSKVENCIKGAATSTGCSFKICYNKDDSCDNLVTSQTMCEVFTKFAEMFGLLDNDVPVTDQPLGSTDMGNVSHVVPSIHPHIGINTNAIYHTAEFTAASGSQDAQLPILNAAKAMAMTALTLMRNPEKLQQAKLEFNNQMTRRNC